jgi:hypothetical protein
MNLETAKKIWALSDEELKEWVDMTNKRILECEDDEEGEGETIEIKNNRELH